MPAANVRRRGTANPDQPTNVTSDPPTNVASDPPSARNRLATGHGFWQFKRVVQSGLAVTHEPAYADERSKDCEAKSASE